MEKKISVFLPTRAGSERIKSKNTRTFANVNGGLLRIKLEQLSNCSLIDEIILSTNDPESIEIARNFSCKKLVIKERPNELAQSATDLVDLVMYVPEICSHEHILWTHVTSPLVLSGDYHDAIIKYFDHLNKGSDSLMSVKEILNFIWDKKLNGVVNKQHDELKKWPRTQDLTPIYEVNSALFIASKKIYFDNKDRIGKKPFLYKQNAIKSTDVDWEEDFKLAELLYEHFK